LSKRRCEIPRKSQQGHLIFYNSRPIIWKCNRQRTIALSATEAELDSFVRCVRSVLHTMRIWKASDPHSTGVNMFEDNRSTIAICTSPKNSRTKHVDLRIKWLQDHLQKGGIKIHVHPDVLREEIRTVSLPLYVFIRLWNVYVYIHTHDTSAHPLHTNKHMHHDKNMTS
jgi:hypothetical protein